MPKYSLDAALQDETTLTTEGLLRWNSNGRVPPADCVERAYALGMSVDPALCTRVRDTELQQFLAAYRAADPQMDEEQLAEARANHPAGTVLVNVITGRRTKL